MKLSIAILILLSLTSCTIGYNVYVVDSCEMACIAQDKNIDECKKECKL